MRYLSGFFFFADPLPFFRGFDDGQSIETISSGSSQRHESSS